jgi:PAS domain S-box-containing protein
MDSTKIEQKCVEENHIDLKEICCRYKVLIETNPDCIKFFDIDGNLIYINPAGVKEHYLTSLEEALSSKWNIIDSVVDEDKPKVKKAFQEAVNNRKTTSLEIRHMENTSNREVCLETIVPIESEGKLIGVFGICRDITEIKKMEKDLLNSKIELEKNVEDRTKELAEKINELKKINEVMTGREIKMIELKKQIEEMKKS